MKSMRINPFPCPYCKTIINGISLLDNEQSPKEGDVMLCVTCGEFIQFGPFLSIQKCDLTPDQLADKLGLLLYGSMLQGQEKIKFFNKIKQTII